MMQNVWVVTYSNRKTDIEYVIAFVSVKEIELLRKYRDSLFSRPEYKDGQNSIIGNYDLSGDQELVIEFNKTETFSFFKRGIDEHLEREV